MSNVQYPMTELVIGGWSLGIHWSLRHWPLVIFLPFAILEALPRAGLAVFLPLSHPRVAGEQAVSLEGGTKIHIGLQQGSRNAMPHSPGLAKKPASCHTHLHIILTGRFGHRQRLGHRDPLRFGRKIIFARTAI